ADERAAQQTATGELTVIPGTLAQPGRMDGPRLALQDHAIDGAKLVERRQADIPDVGAELLQRGRDIFEPRRDLRVRRQVGFMEMPDETDTQSPHAALQPGRVMARRYGRAAGIERIVTRDRGEHQRI